MEDSNSQHVLWWSEQQISWPFLLSISPSRNLRKSFTNKQRFYRPAQADPPSGTIQAGPESDQRQVYRWQNLRLSSVDLQGLSFGLEGSQTLDWVHRQPELHRFWQSCKSHSGTGSIGPFRRERSNCTSINCDDSYYVPLLLHQQILPEGSRRTSPSNSPSLDSTSNWRTRVGQLLPSCRCR